MQSEDVPHEDIQPEYDRKQFCYFKLSQTYDINQRNTDDPQPFSSISGDLTFNNIVPYVSLDTDAAWNPYENRITTRNIAVGLADNRGDRLSVEYRRNRNKPTESLNMNTTIVLTDRFSIYAVMERDLEGKKDIESRASLLYKTGCWSVDFGITKTEEDRKYAVQLNLFGLGGFGSSIRPE